MSQNYLGLNGFKTISHPNIYINEVGVDNQIGWKWNEVVMLHTIKNPTFEQCKDYLFFEIEKFESQFLRKTYLNEPFTQFEQILMNIPKQFRCDILNYNFEMLRETWTDLFSDLDLGVKNMEIMYSLLPTHWIYLQETQKISDFEKERIFRNIFRLDKKRSYEVNFELENNHLPSKKSMINSLQKIGALRLSQIIEDNWQLISDKIGLLHDRTQNRIDEMNIRILMGICKEYEYNNYKQSIDDGEIRQIKPSLNIH